MVKNWKSTLLAVGLGLLLSLLATSTLFATSQLARTGINAPASQHLLYYLLLALINGGILFYRRKPLKVSPKRPLKERLYSYIMLSLVDVIINFFVVEAIHHTPLTSFVLLDTWTITCSLLLGCLFLKKKYGVQILIGIAICVASYATVFISDVHSVDGIKSSVINLVKGDMFVIVESTLSGVSIVLQGFLKKNDDRVTYNAFLGIFGAILTALQIVMSEQNEFIFILYSPAIFFVIGFSLSKIFLYIGIHYFYKIDGSTMLDLPILIIYNIWIILIRIFIYHEKVDWIYFVAVAGTTLGLGLMIFSRGDEIDPNNGEPPIDEEADLVHSDKIEISHKDRHKIFSIELQNSLCYMSCLWSEVN